MACLPCPSMRLLGIEVVEDRTPQSRPDEGFLRVSRLRLRNVYDDGSRSDVYNCDVVARPGSDAVVATLYRQTETGVEVLLREGVRPPVYLRKDKRFVHPDPREYTTLVEVVAGMVEDDDPSGERGLRVRAAVEAEEELGTSTKADAFSVLGGETFASPGTSDEKVYYCAGPASALDADRRGDGSVMEELSEPVREPLADAVESCRTGRIPDMKTEIALLRLADHLGYIPQLDCYVDELPEPLRSRYRRLGVAPA